MRFLPIALALCLLPTAALADGQPGQCYQKTITVCPYKKPKKKKVLPPPVVEKTEKPVCPEVPHDVTVHVVCETKTVTRTRVVEVPKCPGHPCRKEPKVVFGGYAALGVGVRDQYVQGNLGLQLEVPKAHLGLRAFSALDKGVGFQALIYAYRGDKLKVHVVDPGVLITGDPFNYTNNTDVPRRVDLLLGAGIQYRVLCNLDLTADWRVNIADPVTLADKDGVVQTSGPHAGKYLDAAHVVGNSFSSSQILLGVLLHL